MKKLRIIIPVILLLILLVVAIPSTSVTAGIYGPIANVNSGKCMDIPGAARYNGAPVDQYNCPGAKAGIYLNELWKAVPVGGGWYNIVNINSNLCLDATGRNTANGTKLQQWACPGGGGTNQQWMLKPVANKYGVFNIIGRQSLKCVDVTNRSTANGTYLQLWDCPNGGGLNQQWFLPNN